MRSGSTTTALRMGLREAGVSAVMAEEGRRSSRRFFGLGDKASALVWLGRLARTRSATSGEEHGGATDRAI